MFKGYDLDYYKKLIKIQLKTQVKINLIRWQFVLECKPTYVLDYGCGCGFFTLPNNIPPGVKCDSFDIGRWNGKKYPQTGIRRKKYDLVCFWDVLEHVDWENKPDKKILETMVKAKNVALTIPIKPNNNKLENWKHYKPGEHLTYFSEKSIDRFLDIHGFDKIKSGYPECPPRVDIYSALYKRKGTV